MTTSADTDSVSRLNLRWPDYFGLSTDRTFLETRASHYPRIPVSSSRETFAHFIPEKRSIRGIDFRYLIPGIAYEASPFLRPAEMSEERFESFLEGMDGLSSWDSCVLSRLSLAQERSLGLICRKRGLSLRTRPQNIHALPGDLSWENYFSTRGFKLRKSTRNGWNIMAREGMNFRADLAADDIKNLYIARNAVKDEADYSIQKQFLDFITDLRKRLAAEARLHEVGLFSNDRLIAMALAFRSGNDLQVYQTAYDPAFQKMSPGRLVLLKLIQENLGKELRVIDLMSEGDHAAALVDTSFEYRQVTLFSKSLRGRLLSSALAVRE